MRCSLLPVSVTRNDETSLERWWQVSWSAGVWRIPIRCTSAWAGKYLLPPSAGGIFFLYTFFDFHSRSNWMVYIEWNKGKLDEEAFKGPPSLAQVSRRRILLVLLLCRPQPVYGGSLRSIKLRKDRGRLADWRSPASAVEPRTVETSFARPLLHSFVLN